MTHQEIRALELNDLEDVLVIERQSYDFPWAESIMRDCLANPHYQNLALFEEDEIQSYSICSRVLDELSLLNLCVSPKSRGKGLGRQLLQAIIDKANAEAVKLIYLEVRESNAPAISLYQSVGFNEVGIRPGYYPSVHSPKNASKAAGKSGREDAILMTLQLELDLFI